MKKSIKITALVLAVLTAMFVFVGCQGAKKDEPKDSGEAKKVGIAIPTATVNRFPEEAALMVEGFEALGYEVIGNLVADDDANKQLQQCQNMIANGADLLVVCPVDATSSAQIVEEAHAEGVAVISYVRVMGGDVDYLVSDDNNACGTQIGEFVA